MAIVSTGTTLNYAARTSAAVPVPASAATDHIAIVDLFYEAAPTITPPTGFTLEAHSGPWGSTPVCNVSRFWKRLTGADTGTWAFGLSSSTPCMAVAILLSGRATSGSPFDTSTGATVTGGTASGAPVALSIAATTTGVDLLFTTGSYNSNSTGLTGWTLSVNQPDGMTLNTKVNQSSGQPGSSTPNGGTDTWNEILSAVLPAGGGGPTLPPELIMQTRRPY